MNYFDFNFSEKRYEILIGNNYVLFDSKMKILPIIGKNNNKNKIQIFIPENEPKYMLNFDGKMVFVEDEKKYENGEMKLIKGGYTKEVTVCEITSLNYFRKEFSIKTVTDPILDFEVEKIFNNFIKEAIINLKENPDYEFVPNEVPNVEDFVKLYAMAHLK